MNDLTDNTIWILSSKCQLTGALVSERQQITEVCTDFRKIPNAFFAVWEEKLT